MKTFKTIANEIGNLLEKKNADYGSAFEKAGHFLHLLYPNGIKPDEYVHVLLIVRIFDKLMRVSQGALDDSFKDIAGYGILGEYQVQFISGEGFELQEGMP